MKSVEFKFAGIEFKVDLYIDESNKCLDSVVGVYCWNDSTKHYEYVSCNHKEFEKDFEDQINEAIEEMYENERLVYADMMFDAYREEHGLETINVKKELV